MAEWAFAVLAAAPQNQLHFVNWILLVPGALIAAGLYIMVAAHVPSYPLFGRTKVREATERRQQAEHFLGQFHAIGDTYATVIEEVTHDEVALWYNNARAYVLAAWGVAEHSSLRRFAIDADPVVMASRIVDRVTGLVERCKLVPVRDDFTWNPPPPWKKYLDAWFLENWSDDGPTP